MSGICIFESRPLAEVIEELNRHRRGRIVIVNPALRGLKVTGVFPLADPDGALEVIQRTLHLRAAGLTPLLVLLH